MSTVSRSSLVGRVADGAREIATDGIVMHQAIADRLGLHITDLRCLNLLSMAGPSTAGEIAERTGLTTGAVTRMIDRLVKSGHVTRVHDESDRRRVIIDLVPERGAEIAPLYADIAKSWSKLMEQYSTDEIAFIADLFAKMHTMNLDVLTRLHTK